MDANLMGSARFQPTFDQGVVAQMLDRPNVGYRPFSRVVQRGTATEAIPPIPHEIALDRLSLDDAMDNRQIATMDGVLAKLLRKMRVGAGAAGKEHQAAGIPIDAVDGPDSR